MKTIASNTFLKKYLLFPLFIFSFYTVNAQTETIPTGSFLVNMGNTNAASINDDVRPYGMIYDLMRNYNVPVKWVIDQAKAKDGADFTHNGIVYRGGTFIIPAQFRSTVVNSRIAFWQTQGVVGTTSVSDFTAYVHRTLVSVPRWTLDAANGKIAEAYLAAAGITNTGFSLSAYNWKAVTALDCCDDFFVMPHADPTWATHSRLFTWNRDCLGSIWAACHAVSALENAINPANNTQQMNFLSTRTGVFTPTPWPNNSLKLWGTHSGGSIPYSFNTNKASDPVAQYMGVTDLSQLNGSEQIYIPKQSTDPGGATRWRPGANIIAFDPTQVNVPVPDLANGNVAATVVYGRAFDDNQRGFVMYEAGHSHLKGTTSDGPALRAFLNFSFFQVQPKAPQLGAIGGFTPGQLVSSATPLNLSISATSPLSGITFSYLWRATNSAGTPVGTFSNDTSATTTYTPPSVAGNTDIIISCVVTDNCGRASFQNGAVIAVPPPRSPVVNNESVTLQPECGGVTATTNVLANDSDPDGDPITLTIVAGNSTPGTPFSVTGGTVIFTTAGLVTFTADEGYTGTVTLPYTVCDNTTPQCTTTGVHTILVGDPQKIPLKVDDATTIAEDIPLIDFNVLTNDQTASNAKPGGYTGGTLSLYSASVPGAQGRVAANPNGTITYIPSVNFSGTATISYVAINTAGYKVTGTVTVTVTNDGCDAETLQVTPPSSGSVTLTMITGASGDADTYLNQDGTPAGNSINNYGTCVDISVNRRATDRAMRGLTKFNLSAIPAGAVVTSATLRLYLNREGGAAYDISVHKVLEDWSEGTVCGNNGVANWTVRSGTTTNWSTAGGVFGAALATTNIPRTTGVYYQWTGLQATVNEWLGSPTTNNGFLLKAVTENIADDRFEFDSREATNKPQLVINYTIPAVCADIPNRAPLANNDFGYTTINTSPLVISNVKANDSDDGAFNVTGATVISGGGTVGSITNDGFTYTPVAGTTGAVVVEYTISDGTLTDVARVEIVVTGTPIDAVNDNPAPANSGVVQNINVMANDVDPENQKGILTIVTQPANGTAAVNDNGTPANFADDFITYTPAPGFYGIDNFTYQVCENPPAATCPVPAVCDGATVTVTVLNQPPVANNDNVTILPCLPTTINLISNDTDPEAGAVTITSISALSNPAAGTLVNNNDGTVTFTPATGFTGSVSFTYTIQDNVGLGALSNATVTLNVVNPVNTTPVALDDAETINMDEVYYFSVLDNDSDPQSQPLTFPTIITQPLHGTVIVNPLNGLLEYTPNPGYYGTDVIVYEICDRILDVSVCALSNGLCDQATLTITILPPPNTTNSFNDEHSTWQDVNVSSNVLTNDLDMENDVQVLGGFYNKDLDTYQSSGTFNVYAEDGVTLAGTITVAANGNFTFDPLPTFSGIVSLPYYINDVVSPVDSKPTSADSAFLKITVTPLPVIANSIIANNDEYSTPLNTNVVSSITAYNDFDPQGNSFTVTSYTFDSDGNGTQDGTVTTLGTAVQIGGISTTGIPTNNAGTLTLNYDGTFTFNPQNDFTGSIDVVYTITDALGATTTAVLHINVSTDTNGTANDVPFAGDDFKYTNVNTPVNGNALSNDSDPNAGNIITATPQTTTIPGVGTLQLASNGSYTFTPAPGYTGPVAFPYTICDNQAPALCKEATLHFLVGIDNSTDAVNDENSTWQDVNVGGGVVANDFDAETNTQTFGNFLAQGATPGAPISSGATLNGINKLGAQVTAGVLTFAADGSYTFDPDPTFTGTVTVPYSICDNGNLSKCDTAYLTITVDPLPGAVNTLIANNDENISYGSAVSSNVILNDDDPQPTDAFTVTAVNGVPVNVGSSITVAGVDLNGNTVTNAGTLVINENGTYTYTPATGFVGSINIPYTITDNNASPASATAILHIDVLKDPNGPANDPPFGGDDFQITQINTTATGTVLGNDSDPNGNSLTVTAQTTTVAGGTLTLLANGTYTFVPVTGYVGPVVFSYEICDGQSTSLCATAELHFLVSPLGSLPVTGLEVTARLSGNNAIIDWKTESESNTDYFVVERSINNVNFIQIGTVVAAGNSITRRDYSLTDDISALPQTVVYYRIRQVDMDGKSVLSNIVTVRKNLNIKISAYPNPFVSDVMVTIYSQLSGVIEMRLTDVSGHTVLQQKNLLSRGTNQFTVNNLAKLPAGTYLLEVINKAVNSLTTIKLIKQ